MSDVGAKGVVQKNAVVDRALVKPYGYSFDRDRFVGEFATREQALEAGFKAAEGRSAIIEAVFVGKRVATNPQADHHAEEVVRAMKRRMLTKAGDASYLSAANEHVLADLDSALERTIIEWLDRHELAPPAKVMSVTEHPLPSVQAHGPSRDDEVHLIGPEQ